MDTPILSSKVRSLLASKQELSEAAGFFVCMLHKPKGTYRTGMHLSHHSCEIDHSLGEKRSFLDFHSHRASSK
jgi:hypothetical protein